MAAAVGEPEGEDDPGTLVQAGGIVTIDSSTFDQNAAEGGGGGGTPRPLPLAYSFSSSRCGSTPSAPASASL